MDSNKFAGAKTSNKTNEEEHRTERSSFQMVTAFVKKFRHFTLQFRYVLISLVLLNISPLFCLAQDRQAHTPRQQELTQQQKSKTSALITIVRESTERFKNVLVAEKGGYVLQFGCVSELRLGTNRHKHLIGADFVVITEVRERKKQYPPEPIAQLVRYLGFSNRLDLPANYTLHVWAWKDNPNDALVNWHPDVSCELFGGQTA
jgi:hypothetical protein